MAMEKSMKTFLYIFGLVFFLSSAFANETANRVKNQLQQDLLTHYLSKLEATFGDCGSHPSSCLSTHSPATKDQYVVASLPRAQVCFPYTMCGFYHCMEKTYNCSEVGVNYFTQLAFPTCSAYEANIEKKAFSDQAIEWIYSVMVCLQKGLVDECFMSGSCPTSEDPKLMKKTCDHITDFTLQYHPGCYIESGVGVCHLPLKDKMAIWKTVNPFMTKREKQEAYKVIFECFKP